MFMKLKCPDCDKKKLGNKVEFFYVLNLTCSSGAEKVCAVETSNESQAYGIAAETLQSEVHSEVSKSYEAPTDVPVVDISVSFDGSWLTRGHTSLIGIVGVIDILTGYVIDFEVMCKECFNHVSKRLGTGLRNAVKESGFRGISLGGKGHGTLKEATIKKLTLYYQEAIVQNKGNVPAMKKAIDATLHHSITALLCITALID
ncbi:uncharacterized protein TNCV_4696982 [Trichonephila clavipes]|nr:uncharacterized protein TNCV_4696982 [Trichonephila clavipes]